MIFIANSSGTIVNSKVETVYQGTSGAQTIYLICPYLRHSSVTAQFTLPNGVTPDAYTMTYMREIDAFKTDDNAAVQGWSLDVPATVTAYYGIVSVRFTWYSAAGAVIASSVTTFRVARGIAAELPEAPDDDTYTKILAMLADITEYTENIQARVDSVSFHYYAAETDKSSTVTLQLSTVSVEDGAIVQEGDFVVTASNDIYRIGSINDDTGEMTVSFIMNIRGTDALVQSDVWISDKTLKYGYTVSIPSDEIAFNRTPEAGDWFLLIKQNESGEYEQATYIACAKVVTVNEDTYTVTVSLVTRISAVGFISLELTDSDGENDTYTLTFSDGTTYNFKLSTKVDLTTYTEEQAAQDTQIAANTSNIATNTKNITTNTSNITTNTKNISANTSNISSLKTRVTEVEGDIGDTSAFSSVAQDIATAIKSLNEDVDSLQLGVVPRIIRGLIYDEDPATLDDELKAALTAAVKEATGRDTPNNTDAVKVMDSAAPAEDSMYTYFYWSSEVSSDLDGWYLAEYYLSPSVTSIPSFVYVILNSSWTSEADEDGLYYITISPDEHGMGTDNSINVDLHRLVDGENYESINQFYVTASGSVILYTDEKFTGKLIIRTGKAYYISDTTATETVDMDQVDGLAAALAEKANTADLADVATSGSYNDLTDTPTISDYKVQQSSVNVLVNAEYPLIIKYTNGTSTVTDIVTFYSSATYNPSTNTITANIKGDVTGNAKTATVAYKAPVAEVLIRIDYLSASDTSTVLSAARAMFTVGGYDLINLFDTEALDTIKAMPHDKWLDLTAYELSLYAVLNQLGHTGIDNALPATGVFDGSSVMGIYAKRTDGEEEVYLDLYSSKRYSYLVETTDADTEIEFAKVKFYLIMREDYVNYGV